MKRKLVIGIVVSAAILYLALRGIDWGEFAAAFARTSVWYVVLAAAFTMSGHYVRAYRWRFMLRPIRNIPTWRLFSATCIGLAFNNLLPARLGEVIRAYAVGRTESISPSAAFGTIVYERVVDVFGLLALLWLTLLNASGPEWLRRSGVILLACNVVLLALLYVMVRYQARFLAVAGRIYSLLPDRFSERATSWTRAFVDGLHVVRSRSAIVPMIVTSIGVWGLAWLGVYFCLVAMQIHVPPIAAVVVLVLITLGTMIPSAPAYLGPVQYACVLALGIYRVDSGTALAYSIVFHAHHFLPVTTAGLLFAWRSHIHVSDATRQAESVAMTS